MTKDLTGSAKKVQDALLQKGFTCEVKELPSSTRTAQEAADSIGCEVAQIAKSLVFIDELTHQLIIVIASGIHQVNLNKVEKLTGLKLSKADGTFVKSKIGFAIGGVPPIGHKEAFRTLLDPTLKNYQWIWAAAGTPFAVFRLRSNDLQKMTNGEFIELA